MKGRNVRHRQRIHFEIITKVFDHLTDENGNFKPGMDAAKFEFFLKRLPGESNIAFYQKFEETFAIKDGNGLVTGIKETETKTFIDDFVADPPQGQMAFHEWVKGRPEGLVAWMAVSNHDVRLNTSFLDKAVNLTPAQLDKVAELYNPAKFQYAGSVNQGKVNYSHSKTITGPTGNSQQITINYDANGFPDFTTYNPGLDYVYKPDALNPQGQALVGYKNGSNGKPDFDGANGDMQAKFNTQPGMFEWDGQSTWFKIHDTGNFLADQYGYVQYTWHHHQDGKTMFPVPSKIHNINLGGFQHTGGGKILEYDLEGLLFNSPF